MRRPDKPSISPSPHCHLSFVDTDIYYATYGGVVQSGWQTERASPTWTLGRTAKSFFRSTRFRQTSSTKTSHELSAELICIYLEEVWCTDRYICVLYRHGIKNVFFYILTWLVQTPGKILHLRIYRPLSPHSLKRLSSPIFGQPHVPKQKGNVCDVLALQGCRLKGQLELVNEWFGGTPDIPPQKNDVHL